MKSNRKIQLKIILYIVMGIIVVVILQQEADYYSTMSTMGVIAITFLMCHLTLKDKEE